MTIQRYTFVKGDLMVGPSKMITDDVFGSYVHYADHIAVVERLRTALEDIRIIAIYGCGTKQKDRRGTQFGAIIDKAIAILAETEQV